ncbi:putative transaminase [Lupinus albus]|uniref:Putative transaminase n=1 Tax=Lupinus albus TaxID=3870 RepID=A0A6A4PPU9_LUPAL|nr:putative transaminase [Lupinus albus]
MAIHHSPLLLNSPSHLTEYANVDWDSFGFELMPIDYMYINKCSAGHNFGQGHLTRYGHIQLSPSSGAQKHTEKENGQVVLFRPEQNAIRMKNGAERMCMTSPSIDEFVHALKLTVLANKRWVPPPGKGSLYLRPLLLGTGPVLGLAPSLDYTFLIYASPVRSYFKVSHSTSFCSFIPLTNSCGLFVPQEGSAPLNLCVDEDFDRACPRGTASVKTISNYAFQTFYWKKNVFILCIKFIYLEINVLSNNMI